MLIEIESEGGKGRKLPLPAKKRVFGFQKMRGGLH